MSRNTSEVLVERLIDWGVGVVFGLPGDGINGIMEALRIRQDRISFLQVQHEEAAAFMACGYAKYTGRLGVCLATSGPGAIHLLNGLARREDGRRTGARDHRPDVSRSDRHAPSTGSGPSVVVQRCCAVQPASLGRRSCPRACRCRVPRGAFASRRRAHQLSRRSPGTDSQEG